MQYLLTAEEYSELNRAEELARRRVKEQLQRVCTLAAEHVPVNTKPWGCILSENKMHRCGYCDDCPVRKECPYPDKEFSK
jgi:hypothetical protein